MVIIINLEHWFLFDFKLELVNAFMDVDHELRLHHQVNALKQQTSIS